MFLLLQVCQARLMAIGADVELRERTHALTHRGPQKNVKSSSCSRTLEMASDKKHFVGIAAVSLEATYYMCGSFIIGFVQ